MDATASPLAGCVELQPRVHADIRGFFAKPFDTRAFESMGLETGFVECYWSSSHRGVVRGMHCQLPPADHAKLVWCVHGAVFDVVLDLRAGSPTYGRATTFALDATRGNAVYVPRGMAHGFCATSDTATLVYLVTSAHSPAHDAGVSWRSVDVDWPVHEPIVSARDAALPALAAFRTPFVA